MQVDPSKTRNGKAAGLIHDGRVTPVIHLSPGDVLKKKKKAAMHKYLLDTNVSK